MYGMTLECGAEKLQYVKKKLQKRTECNSFFFII